MKTPRKMRRPEDPRAARMAVSRLRPGADRIKLPQIEARNQQDGPARSEQQQEPAAAVNHLIP